MTSLRIAFFGSDKFSVKSLSRLVTIQKSTPSMISSIDVYTRSIKPTGRKLKTFTDIPIGSYASQLGLPLFRVDSSNQIESEASHRAYNLAIAVSYGKLIPGSFLSSLQYGGLNVHPSLLPRFSGSSPIQAALMSDCESTGVTVQTLHPTKFDHGDILQYSENIPISDSDDYSSLQEKLALVGADLLAEVITKGLFKHPKPLVPQYQYSLALKISPAMYAIDWNSMTSRMIKRRYDALGPVHSFKYSKTFKKKPVESFDKVIFSDIEVCPLHEDDAKLEIGNFRLLPSGKLLIRTIDGAISVGLLKYQFCGNEDAEIFMARLKKRSGDTSHTFFSKPQ